jgi:hypothetical protein
MREPTGVGLEVPAWLVVLQEEVDRVLDQDQNSLTSYRLDRAVPLKSLARVKINSQLMANRDRQEGN